MNRRLFYGTFFISLSVLMFELLLIRLLSTVFSPSIAFLGVSFALFGLAFGGIIVYFMPNYFSKDKFPERIGSFSIYYSLSLIATTFFLSIANISWIDINLIILLPTIPLILANICLSILFKYKNQIINKLYFFDLAGAGLGVIIVIILMNFLDMINVIIAIIIASFISIIFFNSIKKRRRVSIILILLSTLLIIINHNHKIVKLEIAFSKIDKQYNQLLLSKWNSFSHITVSKLLGEYANDRSLHLKIDGDAATEIYKFEGDFEKINFLKKDLASLIFQTASPGKALIIGSGGGRDVLMSLMFGHQVTGVDINPIINNLMKNEYREYNGNLYYKQNVNIITAEGRSFIKKNKEKYNTISIPLVDTWASTAAGNLALVESYLYTVEAFEDYLKTLNENGILSVSRWDMEGMRILSVFLKASERLGINEPKKNIAILQGGTEWSDRPLNNYLFKKTPFTKKELQNISNFNNDNQTKILYVADGNNYKTEQYDFLSAEDKGQYTKEYLKKNKKRIDPVYDNNPFFFFTTSFTDVNGIVNGQLGITFVLITILSLICIIIPLFSRSKNKIADNKNTIAFLGYFGSLGLAFILIEMVMIQKFILYLEKPIYSYSVILTSLLIFASIGSLLSKKMDASKKRVFIKNGFIIFTIILIYSLTLDKIINSTMSMDIIYKIFFSTLVIAPVAIFMGIMLPLGIKRLSAINLDELIPWTWAVNGALSVFATVLAIMLAINIGLNAVLLIGGVCYLIALIFISFSKNEKKQ